MARIDDDIVAKASFYAGLSQTYAPEELPFDIRANGNSILRDIVNAVGGDAQVDRGQIIVTKTFNKQEDFAETSGLTPYGVIFNGKKLEPVGVEDFYTIYRNNANVCCIHNSVVTSTEINPVAIIVDQFGRELTDDQGNILVGESIDREKYDDVISVKTWCDGTFEILCDKSVSVDETLDYLRVDCRMAVRNYIVDYLAYRMATMYGLATAESCANNMAISLNQCKKRVASHLTYADPLEGMKRMMNANGSPNYARGY